jgi:heme exporter protein B
MQGYTTFLRKEWLLERRQRTTLGGVLLYVLALVFVTGLVLHGQLSAQSWTVVLWLLLSLSALGALTRSFVSETPGQLLLLYQWGSATAILLAKLTYNTLVVVGYSIPAALLYAFLLGNEVVDVAAFGLALLLGALALSSTLTLTSALVARAGGQYTLMAVLSLPLLVPQLLVLIRITIGAVLGVARYTEMLTSLGLSGVAVGLGLLLFPYLWQE